MGIKKIKKSSYNLSTSEQKLCHGIIHTASTSAAAVGAGLAQLPLADNAVITPIQVTMIISLGKVFDQEINKTVAKGLLGGFIANFVGRGVAQAAWGWVPGIGNASNAITAAAITESVGWICVDHFYKEKYLKKIYPSVQEETMKADENPLKDNENKADELKRRVNDFLSGVKNRTDDKKEYYTLLGDFEEYFENKEDGKDELYDVYDKLLHLK